MAAVYAVNSGVCVLLQSRLGSTVETPWQGGRAFRLAGLLFLVSRPLIDCPQSGVNVRKDGQQEWGTVAADKADLNGLVTQRAGAKERLTPYGGLTVDNVLEALDGPPRLVVHGEPEFERK
ncbi:hypothetical protein [Kitasatospora sp. NPDC054795]